MQSTRPAAPVKRRRLLPAFSVLAMTLAALSLNGCGSDDAVVVTPPVVVIPPDTSCAILTDAGSVVVGSGVPGDPSAPEPSSGFRAKNLTSAKTYHHVQVLAIGLGLGTLIGI